VTIATLAVAIGANTAVFAVADALLWAPMRVFQAPDRLISIRDSAPGSPVPEELGVELDYQQYRENANMLEDVGMYRPGSQETLRVEARGERVAVTFATSSVFTTLQVDPALGRLPTSTDPPMGVALITHSLWTNVFDADSTVLGRTVELGGVQRTVIGVMGSRFRFPDEQTSIWVNMEIDPDVYIRPDELVARVAPGVDRAALVEQLSTLVRRVPERFGGPPDDVRIAEQHRPIVRPLAEDIVGDVATPLWLLLGAAGIVLLIACVNVGNLFAARAEARRRDLAIRRALGSGRGGIIRTVMVEAGVLAVLGGSIGLVLARATLPILGRVTPESLARLETTGMSGPTVLFTIGVSILTVCVFGLLPAVRFTSSRWIGSTTQVGEPTSRRTRGLLVSAQTACALVLLVGAALLLRSYWNVNAVDPGYNTSDILSFQITPDRAGLTDGPTYAALYEELLEGLRAMPGTTSASLTHWLPLDEGGARTMADLGVSAEEPLRLRYTQVDGRYFETMGIGLIRGRTFGRADQLGSANVIVSTSTAAALWPDVDPLGRQIRLLGDGVRLPSVRDATTSWYNVIGVVEDVLLDDLQQTTVEPTVYLPIIGPEADSWVVDSPAFVIRSTDAGAMVPAIRSLIGDVVPESPVYRLFTIDELKGRSTARLSFTMSALIIAGLAALILGGAGIYGTLAYSVSRRTREISVRMALGAEARRVRVTVVWEGLRVTLAGVAIGLIGAVGMGRLLNSLLFGVRAFDVATVVTVTIILLGVAVLASYVPARRASEADPMRALRAG
jgi:predicted permease